MAKGFATWMHAQQEAAYRTKCKNGVHEVHTREQLILGFKDCVKIEVSGRSRADLLVEIGVLKSYRAANFMSPTELAIERSVRKDAEAHMFPLARNTFPVGNLADIKPKED